MRQAGLLVAGLLVLLEAHSLCLEGRLRRCCAMSAEAFPKSVKRKCAILTGFHGQKFYGSQMNSDASCPSVESTLFQGLLDAGLVHPSNAVSAKKIGLTSASRVDRGVSAVRFVTIAKLEVAPLFRRSAPLSARPLLACGQPGLSHSCASSTMPPNTFNPPPLPSDRHQTR
mmetsp:Transcript_31425/g.91394  ORF Transcript_31425/g.91394 Transcript_31425/m.91394 type:complete len:171 (+) Transcript_31425:125-637(+)